MEVEFIRRGRRTHRLEAEGDSVLSVVLSRKPRQPSPHGIDKLTSHQAQTLAANPEKVQAAIYAELNIESSGRGKIKKPSLP